MFRNSNNQIGSLFSILIIVLIAIACHQPLNEENGRFEGRKSEPANNSGSEMSEPKTITTPGENVEPVKTESKPEKVEGFRANVEKNLATHQTNISAVADLNDKVEKRIYEEYGAILLTTAKPPSKLMFTSDSEVSSFQSSAGGRAENIAGAKVELQGKALDSLKAAIAEAKSAGLSITARDGAEASKRSFAKTLELWNSRFEPALKHWQSKGRLTAEEASRLRSLPIKEQVAAVLETEKKGIYFNTFFNNSILYSVAAPGTSQHLSMLAFDVTEFANPKVQQILAKHGWFRTVQNDAPHFTFLGRSENELPALGLKKVNKKDGAFWIPNLK